MKHFKFTILITLVLFAFSCNTSTKSTEELTETEAENTENTTEAETTNIETENAETETTNEYDDHFEPFWVAFQSVIANDNKEALLAMCNASTKDFLSTKYSTFVNARMKKEVAKITISTIKNKYNGQKFFTYTVSTDTEEAIYGFMFEEIDGKWMVVEPKTSK